MKILLSTLLAFAAVFASAQADPYARFNEYRAAASSGRPYPGSPLRGKVVGFANILGTIPFTAAVENSIKAQLKRAGLDLAGGWISMDNQVDADIGLRNAQMMLKRRPDFFIEFQAYPSVNQQVADMFAKARIPVLAIDVPVPGFPYVGVDNYRVALMAGHHLARLIREKWGGWNGADLVAIERPCGGGDVVRLRSQGVVDALAQEFGIPLGDRRLVPFEAEGDAPEEEGYGMKRVLVDHPDAQRIALYGYNEETVTGMIAAAQTAGRWTPSNRIAVSVGADEIGLAAIRDGNLDATVAFFPERYGEYVVPAVCAVLTGHQVPPLIYMDNEIITRENIDRYYPRKK